MTRPAERFVRALTNDQKLQLVDFWKSGATHRLRCRAHAILMSHDRWSVAEIASAFQVTMQTVYSWLDRWDTHQDLDDAPRSGAPPN